MDENRTALALRQNADISRVKGPVKRKARGVPNLKRVSLAEVHAACDWAGHGTPLGSLLRFMWVTGTRISEALCATPQDFNWQASCVRVATLKRRGGHFRVLPLPGPACGELAQYIAGANVLPHERLWTWTRKHAFFRIREALQHAGVEAGRAKPHALRHGFAFHSIANGVPIPAVQVALGHAHLSTTQVYAHASAADLRAVYSKVAW